MNVYEDSLAPRTRFDWNFSLGDIAVRVHPYFWLTTVFLGIGREWNWEQFRFLPAWLAIVFVSVLIHELGHVLMGRYFGSRGHIILTGFCGLAVGSTNVPDRWQRIAVLVAGPGAGFLFAAVFAGVCFFYYPGYTLASLAALIDLQLPIGFDSAPSLYVGNIIFNVLRINILWGLVNLFPIWPLDGGQVSRELFEHFNGREGMRQSLIVSLATGAGLAGMALFELINDRPLIPHVRFGESWFPLLFFGLLALQSWQLLRFVRLAGPDWDHDDHEPRQPWERDADWWKHGGRPYDD